MHQGDQRQWQWAVKNNGKVKSNSARQECPAHTIWYLFRF
jgi:hypothetical protein